MRLAELLREEELKWYQRAKIKHLLEGDANTKYYYLLANGRHRKTRIFQLEDGENTITSDAQLKEYITSYYKNMFGPSETSLFTLDELRRDHIPQVSDTSLRRRCGRLCSRWSTINRLALMVFQ